MLVTVEGPDASGKSTLVRALCTAFPRRIIVLRSTRPPSTEAGLAREIAWRSQLPASVPILADRDPRVSEPIYGPILRGRSFWPAFAGPFPDALGLVVYCRPPLHALLTKLAGEGQPEQLAGVRENYSKILLEYDQLMETRAHFTYDYTRGVSHFGQLLSLVSRHWGAL